MYTLPRNISTKYSINRRETGQAKKKEEMQAQAKQDQATYDALNYRDDQFDLSDAALALALSLLAAGAATGVDA